MDLYHTDNEVCLNIAATKEYAADSNAEKNERENEVHRAACTSKALLCSIFQLGVSW